MLGGVSLPPSGPSVCCLPDPFFPLSFLVNSWFPGMLDDLFQSVFLCALLLFWLCVYHGVRVQVSTHPRPCRGCQRPCPSGPRCGDSPYDHLLLENLSSASVNRRLHAM